jgi:hypothetical protein
MDEKREEEATIEQYDIRMGAFRGLSVTINSVTHLTTELLWLAMVANIRGGWFYAGY